MAADDNLLAHRSFEAGDLFVRVKFSPIRPGKGSPCLARTNGGVPPRHSSGQVIRCRLSIWAIAMSSSAPLVGSGCLSATGLSIDQSLDDAAFNAELMRKLLAEADKENVRAGGNPRVRKSNGSSLQEENRDSGIRAKAVMSKAKPTSRSCKPD